MPDTSSPVLIQKGSILIYRVFDIAEEVNLPLVEKILLESATGRLSITRGPRRAFVMRNAPVTMNLGEADVRLGQFGVKAEMSAKVWDYGVLSILFQIPIPPDTTWKQLLTRAVAAEDDADLNEVADKKARELTQVLKPALKSPHEWTVFEDYVIFFLEQVKGIENAQELLRQNIASLILAEEKETLAPRTRDTTLETTLQYSEQDLVVIDWNSAIVYERNGQRDIPDVIEFTLTHLMEMRYYDDLLDRRLGDLYDSVESRQNRLWRSRFASLSHEASTRYIEFSEFIERVDNSLKVVGDFYLATVFRAAARRFRLQEWQQSITRKMGILAQVSELLQGEVNVWRSHLLEIVIIVLIIFELASAVFKVGH